MPLNNSLKMVKVVNIMVCIFYHNKKKVLFWLKQKWCTRRYTVTEMHSLTNFGQQVESYSQQLLLQTNPWNSIVYPNLMLSIVWNVTSEIYSTGSDHISKTRIRLNTALLKEFSGVRRFQILSKVLKAHPGPKQTFNLTSHSAQTQGPPALGSIFKTAI